MVDIKYYGVNTKINWTNAESYCQSTYGTHLATITSSIDNAYARIAATNAGIEDAAIWIGYNDIEHEGNFTWIDGSGEGNYTNWNTGEPNNSGEQDCTQLKGYLNTWDDAFCSSTRWFVCNAPGNTAFTLVDILCLCFSTIFMSCCCLILVFCFAMWLLFISVLRFSVPLVSFFFRFANI